MPTGVEIHGKKLRITFVLNRKRYREILDLLPTKPNVLAAARIREQVVTEIRSGVFDYQKHFPDSKHSGIKNDGVKFRDVANEWIDTRDELAFSTVQNYRRIINKHFFPKFSGLDIVDISHNMCRQLISKTEWNSAKTRNNVLSVLRSIFYYAKMSRLIKFNPSENIGFKKLQKPHPDPLSMKEIESVLNNFFIDEWKNYFEFAFFSGLRTSEIIALEWNDIDFIQGLIWVNKAKVRKRIKETKTYEDRFVKMNERSKAVLKKQKILSLEYGSTVFINPKTKKPINDDKPPRLAWNVAIEQSGVRRRPAYNTRHSYATILLMSGENIAWIAKQMGHSVQMLLRRYARWIDNADSREQGKKLGRFLDQNEEDNGNNV